jgi:glucosamine--fructose-6-phosphate aminotransferase (isomerizing)
MCGIIGVTGAADALDILLDGLERLEYRGYDSAGIALIGEYQISRVRVADGTHSVASLRSLAAKSSVRASTGIGHTRWATHGQPSEANAHPHLDCSGCIALIHNGIIENHAELAEALLAKGHTLASTTDTEVLAHLIEDCLRKGEGLAAAVREALRAVRGSFAIGVISLDEPELIVAARRISPLIVGTVDGASFLASDIPALLEHTRALMAIEDDQVVELRPGSLRITDLQGEPVMGTRLSVDWDLEAAEKDGFDDFMSKEIHEQPRAVVDTLRGRISPEGAVELGPIGLSDEALSSLERVSIVACGSSYHAGVVAKYAIERWARLPVEVEIASEFRYRDPVLDGRSLVIGVSQSGETIDTLQAMRQAKAGGATVLVVANVVDSSMAREADGVLYTRAGPEIGVAATKTVLAQMVALELLGLHLAALRGTMTSEELAGVTSSLYELEAIVEKTVARDSAVAEVAAELVGARDFFFLGRHAGFPTALEGALKLKEISYLHAEGYAGGELKHGPLAVIEPGCVVVAVATGGEMTEKILSNVSEVKSRGATVVMLAEDGDERVASLADYLLAVPPAPALLSPIKDVVPLQQLAYHLARARGLDVDRPRNLAKTVTVE